MELLAHKVTPDLMSRPEVLRLDLQRELSDAQCDTVSVCFWLLLLFDAEQHAHLF